MRAVIAGALLIALASTHAHAVGIVNVTFVGADKYADAGNSRADTPRTLKALEGHLQQLGQRYLADGQTLSIEVLDVDLAGELRPSRRGSGEIRVLRGRVDWPRMKVRYELDSPGQTPRQGTESISDPAYQVHASGYSDSDPLRYEKQMLDKWFRSRFATVHD